MQKRFRASATIRGSDKYPHIRGRIRFFTTNDGVLVKAQIFGLPRGEGNCNSPVLAFHIHGGKSCTGNESDPFSDTGGHYNPNNCKHPFHAGDMPPFFTAKGRAVMSFLTDRFTVDEIIEKTVIIHAMPDDFMTQPSGNAGEKIACGVIE